jgi:hypothetical protein
MRPPFKFWWKVYFCLAALFAVASIWVVAGGEQAVSAIDVADFGWWTISLVGVFGFAFSKAIGRSEVWKVWLPLAVIWELGIFAYDYVYESERLDLWLTVLVVLTVAVLIIPQYVALYLYAYRSEPLWKNRDLTKR